MPTQFDHEKLKVYKVSINFVTWVEKLLTEIPKKHSIYDQLERASTSIPLNIAEGNGKFTSKDRCRFFDIARGSALESAAALDIIAAKGIVAQQEIEPGKGMLLQIVAMLVGLIKSNSDDRAYDVSADYKKTDKIC